MEIPSGAVMRFSPVITWVIGRLLSRSKRRSRFVTIPLRIPASSTIGIPPMLCSFIQSFASPTVEVSESVTGSMIIPLSARLTFLTCRACSSMVIFLWSTPMPPSRAIAMAIADSVTVSIAAETMGTFSGIFLLK